MKKPLRIYKVPKKFLKFIIKGQKTAISRGSSFFSHFEL